ncbi:MAG: glycosyltransferase family 4 protein [Planctomycetes bacterium]|nr:glycosyltransferase family 4 protein [Planctomycetota bacterium]
MHILFLTDNFPPEVNAPASRTFEHCREWVRQGEQVTVITTAPNFPKGKVFAGYKNKLWQTEHMEGIRVIRVWTYIAANEGFLRRILDYVSFMVSAVMAALFVRRVDVVIGTSPQFFTACGAWLVSLYKFRPFVFELRDLWPESIRVVGAMKDSFALDMLEKLELFLYRRADRIISVTHAFKRNLISRGINGDKIKVVTNGVDSSRFMPQKRDQELAKQLGLEGRFVGGYIGTHGLAHALETVLDAAKMAQDEGDQSLAFVLLGDGAKKAELKAKSAQMGLKNVHFVDSVAKDEVPRYWALLDVAIIHLRRSPLFETVIPSKLFECMGMGIPVLHGVAGESAEIVESEGVGIPFPPEDAAALLASMRKLQSDKKLYDTYRENGLLAAKKYDRNMLALTMLKALRKIRVLLLNQAFWPDVVATAQHADDLARYLRSHGDDVSVVASRAIYGERGATLPKRGEREGIKIYRVGLQLFGKRGITPRVFDFTLFYLAALWRCLILPRHDVVVCFTTPPFIALVGVLLKWIKGTRLVYWTMDLYPEVAGAAGVLKRGSLIWKVLRLVDRLCVRQSDQVVALGDFMLARVIEKGADPGRVSKICVWSGAENFAKRPREENPLRKEWGIGDRFTVLYVGNFGLGHDMEAIAGAVDRLKHDDSIRWLFIGDGKAKNYLEKRISDCGAKNIFVGGYQTREQLANVLDVGDTHLVTLLPGWEGLILPSKFFSVLAAGKPVLWVGSERSECFSILDENNCGYQSQPGDGETLAREIQYLASHRGEASEMGQRGKVAYETKYSSAHACKAWQDVLHQIVRPK